MMHCFINPLLPVVSTNRTTGIFVGGPTSRHVTIGLSWWWIVSNIAVLSSCKWFITQRRTTIGMARGPVDSDCLEPDFVE